MPYYKIILHLTNGKKKSGIRKYPEQSIERLKTLVWTKVKETIGRHNVEYVDVIPMPADDSEVVLMMQKDK